MFCQLKHSTGENLRKASLIYFWRWCEQMAGFHRFGFRVSYPVVGLFMVFYPSSSDFSTSKNSHILDYGYRSPAAGQDSAVSFLPKFGANSLRNGGLVRVRDPSNTCQGKKSSLTTKVSYGAFKILLMRYFNILCCCYTIQLVSRSFVEQSLSTTSVDLVAQIPHIQAKRLVCM